MPSKSSASLSAKFGKNLSRLRDRAQVTQEQLAEQAQVSWRYLQQLEGGDGTNPSLEVLCGFKRALKCTWDELLQGIP